MPFDGRDGRDGRDGIDGLDGERGLPGERGLRGDRGTDGHDGIDGKDGAPGRDGVDGKDGHDGAPGKHGIAGKSGSPGPAGPRGEPGPQGEPGDIGPMPKHEWDGTKLSFEFQPGQWGPFVDLQGPPGPSGRKNTPFRGGGGGDGGSGVGVSGNALRSGVGAPSALLGNDGDFYIDSFAHALYGPKTAGVWGSATALVGGGGGGGSGSMPYYIGDGETFTVPEFFQGLYHAPILIEGSGSLTVDGYLIEV